MTAESMPKRPDASIKAIQWRVDACSRRCTRGDEMEGAVAVDGPSLADVMDYLSQLEKSITHEEATEATAPA